MRGLPTTHDRVPACNSSMTAPLPLYLSQFLSGAIWLTLGPCLNSIMNDLDIPLAQGGVPAMAFFFGGICGVLALNLLLARVPIKWCLAGMATAMVVALAAAGLLAGGLWSFTVAYFFIGFPAMVLAGVPGMWVSVHVREKTAWALNLMVLASVTAMTITPLVLGILLDVGVDWRWIYTGEAVLTAVVALVFFVVPIPDISGRENLRLRQIKAVVSANPRLLAAIGVAAFMYMGAEMTLNTWLAKFEVDMFGASAWWAGLAVTVYWVGQIIGRVATIPATHRVFPSTLITVSMALMAGLIVVLALSPTQTVSLVLAFFVGLAASSNFSHISSYSSRFSLWHAGVAFSIFQIVSSVGGMVFPYITGPIAAAWGFRAAIGMAAVCALLTVALATVLRKTSGESAKGQ